MQSRLNKVENISGKVEISLSEINRGNQSVCVCVCVCVIVCVREREKETFYFCRQKGKPKAITQFYLQALQKLQYTTNESNWSGVIFTNILWATYLQKSHNFLCLYFRPVLFWQIEKIVHQMLAKLTTADNQTRLWIFCKYMLLNCISKKYI
jgi:hypothetical protein